MIGGEHLVTLGCAATRCMQKHTRISAFPSFRRAYRPSGRLSWVNPLSHATVIRRIWDIAGRRQDLWQFGIRSGEKHEFEWAKRHTFLTPFDFSGLEDAVHALEGKPVYFSLDLDILDTSVFPGTGTPEPGGVGFKELLSALLLLKPLQIVGLDICELSPPQDPGGASTAAACKVLRELLLLL